MGITALFTPLAIIYAGSKSCCMDNQEKKLWMKSFLTTVSIFFLLSLYLFLRRGYYNVYIINKVFGSTSAILAGITLLVGPLSKQFSMAMHFLNLRKHLGLTALGLGIAHTAVSILLLAHKFPFPSWFFKEWIPVAFGLLALGVWMYLWRISNVNKIQELGHSLWRNRQSVSGHIAFVAIFLHLTVMKYQGWINWFQGKTKQTPELANPGSPPASLFVFAFMIAIIIYRGIRRIGTGK